MTLAEIEETLEKLKVRHPGLDETLLVTLLRAGGWEEKEIKEAVSLFKENSGGKKEIKAFPSPQDALSLPEQIDNDHLLESAKEKNNSATTSSSIEKKYSEPQSLNAGGSSSKREELPHDLPLRPFETSDHIWPFSRYKDVFYGDTDEEVTPPVAPKPTPPKEEAVPMPEPVSTPKPQAPVFVREGPKTAPAAGGKAESGEDKLVILACAMLVAVLFVLGYMYSNGRL